MTCSDFAYPEVSVASLEKLGAGLAAEVFAWPAGGVLKLFRNSEAAGAMQREASNMIAAQATGVPMAHLLGTATIEGRPGILMERIEGVDQLTLLGRRPWIVWRVGTSLGRLHAQLHSAADAGANLRPLKQTIREAVEGSKLVPEDLKPTVLDRLQGLPDGAFLCHGDFHPGNVMETSSGPRIIDWASVMGGDRLADVARTLLLLRSGELPARAPFLLRVALNVVRRLLIRSYLREYRALIPFNERDLKAWHVIATASRLMDGVNTERAALVQCIRVEHPMTSREPRGADARVE